MGTACRSLNVSAWHSAPILSSPTFVLLLKSRREFPALGLGVLLLQIDVATSTWLIGGESYHCIFLSEIHSFGLKIFFFSQLEYRRARKNNPS